MKKEEAIAKIKAWDFLNNDEKEILETLIPELKESLDEMIRKGIISLVNAHGQGKFKESMLAWLEKLKVFAEHGDGLYYFTNSEFTYVGNSYSDVSISHDNGVDIIFDNKPIKHISGEKQGKQKHALDIEIPFGAKDSELQEAEYLIPEGFHAEIKDDEVIIKKGKQKPAAWSEEDERAFHHVLSVLEEYGEEHPSNSKFVCNWLKSIKARMGGDKV